MSEELLKQWTEQAYGLLDSVYDAERVKILDNSIFELSKIRINDLRLYNIEGNEVTVRYSDKGSKTFKTFSL